MISLRKIFYSFSPFARIQLRRFIFAPFSIFSNQKYENGLKVPPRSMIFTGGGDFIETGFRFLEYFKSFGNLQPGHSVLDIGSGMGRMAAPLTHYLENESKYLGLDIMPQAINWCTNNISKHHPNFRFKLLNLKNDLYRNTGDDAENVSLPTSKSEFDFSLLISVFTHMLPQEIDNYLSEINRSLKPGGKCLITFFIFQDEEELIRNNFDKFYLIDHYYALMSKKVKAANVAYKLTYLDDLFRKQNFKRIHLFEGSWKTGKGSMDFQDIIMIEKNQ